MDERPAFEPEGFKAAMRDSWDRAAKGWNTKTPEIHAWLASVTEAMLDLADVHLGSRVVDVAAGAGDQTLDIARRVGPTGYVLATDISPGILQFARDNAKRAGFANIDIKVADAENLGLEEPNFDAVVCRLGLMFCPHPLKALREMYGAVKRAGRVSTVVFSEPQKNPCISILMSTALKHAGMPPRDPYQPGGLLSLGKPGLIDQLFDAAGFKEVRTTRVDAPYRLPSAKHYLDFIRTSASPILHILSEVDEPAKEAAWQELEQRLTAFQTSTGWEGPNELLLTVGIR
jgi:SAM-dependent methyltransferase